jgi:predicted transcriptional regulator
VSRFLKKWLSDRGTTALQVARTAGIEEPEQIWRVLHGRKSSPETLQQFADTLRRVYGMTEQELKEAIA